MVRIANCPGCDERLALPPSAEGSALIRCSICDAEYLLDELAVTTLAEAVLVASTDAENEVSIESFEATDAVSDKTSDDEPSTDATAEPLPGFNFGELSDAPQRVAVGPSAATFRLTGDPAPRRPPRSLLRQMTGVVGGGVLGIAIGYYILLWIGGPERDFLKIGEKLPPWAVPEAFHDGWTDADARHDMAEQLRTGAKHRRRVLPNLNDPTPSSPSSTDVSTGVPPEPPTH